MKYLLTNLILLALVLQTSCAQSNNKNQISRTKQEQTKKEQTEHKPVKKAEEKKGKTKVTFIELGSVRCIPCRKMVPVMESIEAKFPKDVTVIFHDVWTARGKPYAKQFGINTIPTQVFLDKNGEEYFRHVGYFPEEELIKILKQKGVEK